jgi:hypothetical protein
MAQTGARGVLCELRIMAYPTSDYPQDVTVYLVVNDFGPFGKASSKQTSPRQTTRLLSGTSFPANSNALRLIFDSAICK